MARYPIQFGKYLLLERVNVGGMAEVFKAKTFGVAGFERLNAIKRILPTMVEDDEFIRMFIDEARISVQLAHANIVQIYELGRQGEHYYIAMEYVPSRDLRTILDKLRANGTLMPIQQAAFVTSRICDALDYAHRKRDPSGAPMNIIHRDVSPQNVLVGYEGEVKVIDFGIAKAANRASKTQAGVLKGKFGYMSPEQVRGLPIDRRSDIFAVGVLLYEMLTGERLFIGESDFSTLEKVRNAEVVPPTAYNKKINKELEGIVLKALAREVEDRYQWASDLAEDLQPFLIEERSIYSTKRLAAYMREAYAAEIAMEQAKMEEFLKITAPQGEPLQDSGGPEKTFIFEAKQVEAEKAKLEAAKKPATKAAPAPSRTQAARPAAQAYDDNSTDPSMALPDADEEDFVDHGASDELDARTALAPPPEMEQAEKATRKPRAGSLAEKAAERAAEKAAAQQQQQAPSRAKLAPVGSQVNNAPVGTGSIPAPVMKLTPRKASAEEKAAADGPQTSSALRRQPARSGGSMAKEPPKTNGAAPSQSQVAAAPVKEKEPLSRTGIKAPEKAWPVPSDSVNELRVDPSAATMAVMLPQLTDMKKAAAESAEDSLIPEGMATGEAEVTAPPNGAEKAPAEKKEAKKSAKKDVPKDATERRPPPKKDAKKPARAASPSNHKKVLIIGGAALFGILTTTLLVLLIGGGAKTGALRLVPTEDTSGRKLEVLLDDQVVATELPAELPEISVGPHTIKVRGPGLMAYAETIPVNAGVMLVKDIPILASEDSPPEDGAKDTPPDSEEKKGDGEKGSEGKKGEGKKEPEKKGEGKKEPEKQAQPEEKKTEAKKEPERQAEPEKKAEAKKEPEKKAEPKKEPEKRAETRKEPEKKAEPRREPERRSEAKSGGAAAEVVINTKPASRVYLDGKDTRQETPVFKVPLKTTAGTHTFMFKTEDGKKYTYKMNVKAGKDKLIILELGKPPKQGDAKFVP